MITHTHTHAVGQGHTARVGLGDEVEVGHLEPQKGVERVLHWDHILTTRQGKSVEGQKPIRALQQRRQQSNLQQTGAMRKHTPGR